MNSEHIVLWRLNPAPTQRIDLHLPVRIGRAPDCDLRLPSDDVSRLHATLESRGEHHCIVDQGSRNGVYLDGRRVGVAPVTAGSVIRMGQHLLWIGQPNRFDEELRPIIQHQCTQTGPLLIVGEHGSGRRTIARAIHRRSGRGALVMVDHRADEHDWASACSGTILCDEPDDFDMLADQAKGRDVRVLGVATSAGATRSETLLVPSLRQRLNELPSALEAFFERAGGLRQWDPDFIEALACHPFPLNFSELEVLCRKLVLSPSPLGIEQLPHAVRAQLVEARSVVATNFSRDQLHDVLARHRGNIRRVGQELGLGRGQLYRLLAAVGLNPDMYRQASSRESVEPREERRTIQ